VLAVGLSRVGTPGLGLTLTLPGVTSISRRLNLRPRGTDTSTLFDTPAQPIWRCGDDDRFLLYAAKELEPVCKRQYSLVYFAAASPAGPRALGFVRRVRVGCRCSSFHLG